MEIFPAIDLISGQAVRLTQGNYAAKTVYSDSPVAVAATFLEAGARNLHLVDLDGAKDGTMANFDTIREIAEHTKLYTEVGGGIRDEARICAYFDIGVDRVILGSVALQNPGFVAEMIARYGDERIAVGVDALDGYVAANGWLTVSRTPSVAFCRTMREAGVKHIIYTDISRDGAMQGTNMEIYRTLAGIDGLAVTASGGITDYSEIEELSRLGTYGAILGKSLYSGKLDLKSVLTTAEAASSAF